MSTLFTEQSPGHWEGPVHTGHAQLHGSPRSSHLLIGVLTLRLYHLPVDSPLSLGQAEWTCTPGPWPWGKPRGGPTGP